MRTFYLFNGAVQVFKCGAIWQCLGGQPKSCAGGRDGVPCAECPPGVLVNFIEWHSFHVIWYAGSDWSSVSRDCGGPAAFWILLGYSLSCGHSSRLALDRKDLDGG